MGYGLGPHGGAPQIGQRLLAGPGPQGSSQVGLGGGEQAAADLPVLVSLDRSAVRLDMLTL